jgi:GT2 family glycosyltransferase
MHSRSLVSVIIIFFNTEKFIEEAVESVLSQTYERWELMLIDDGSTDKSTDIALWYAAQYPAKIRYLQHPNHQNLGMSASRNLGIWNARGRYVAFLDADDYWLPEKLRMHVAILDNHPEAGMLYGSSKYWFGWTGNPNDAIRDYTPKLQVHPQTSFIPPTLLPLFLEGKTEIPCPCSVMARTDAIKKVGGFEESFRGMYEDQAFYAKMCLSATILATGDCLAWYRIHPESTYSTAISSGTTHDLHYNFLRWLETYSREHGVSDLCIWQALRRQLWLYKDPFRGRFLGLVQKHLRWIKKWILRIEERLLPAVIRSRLWLNR